MRHRLLPRRTRPRPAPPLIKSSAELAQQARVYLVTAALPTPLLGPRVGSRDSSGGEGPGSASRTRSRSSGPSSRRLTVQHSGGRSAGWIVPVRRWCTMRLSTCQSCSVLPGQLDRSRSCIAAGEQASGPCWLSLARKNGTSSCRSSMWWRSGGSSTVPGKNCSRPARSPLTGPWLSVTATHSAFCVPAACVCSSALRGARSRGALSRPACRMTRLPWPRAVRRAPAASHVRWRRRPARGTCRPGCGAGGLPAAAPACRFRARPPARATCPRPWPHPPDRSRAGSASAANA